MSKNIFNFTKGTLLIQVEQIFLQFLLLTAFSANASPLSECISVCSENYASCLDAAPTPGPCIRAQNTCTKKCQQNYPESTPIPQVSSVSPTWGWSGDSIRIQGKNIFNPDLSATVGGQIANTISSNREVSSRLWDIVDFQIPTLHDDTRGPVQFPITITTGGKTFNYTFAYSPVIIGEDYRELLSKGPFLASGYVWVTVELNRETGQVTARTSARVYDGLFDSLPYTVVVMFFDINGRPIGSLETREIKAKSSFSLRGQPDYFKEDWTDAIRPASSLNTSFTNQIRYVFVHISTDDKHTLESQVFNIIDFGKTMAEAIKIFASL